MSHRVLFFALAIIFAIQATAVVPSGAATDAQKLAGAIIKTPTSSGRYKVERIAAYPLQYSTDTPEGAEPEHLKFQFADSKAVLNVYSVDGASAPAFAKKFPAFPATITDLTKILKRKPQTISNMPLIPWIEGVSCVGDHLIYGASKTGKVNFVRQLQFFQQDATLVTNENLVYYAQGISKNKKFYVSLVCHVNAPALQNQPSSKNWDHKKWNNFQKNSNSYYLKINKILAATADSAFTPKLTDLDKILNNLTIEQTSRGSH